MRNGRVTIFFMRIEEMFLTAAEASCRLMMTKAHN